MKTRLLLALAMSLLFVASAAAQQVEPIIYVADFTVKPGKNADFMDLVKKYDAPVFDQLLKDGVITAWGVDVPVLHTAGGSTHSFWWAMPNVGALEKVSAALEEMEKKHAGEGIQEKFLATVDVSKHADVLLREIITGSSATPPANDQGGYLWLTFVKVNPGKGDEFRKVWTEYNKPVYDKLVAEGALHGYAVGVEEAKTTDSFTHYVAVSMPNLAARDKVNAAFKADRDARTAADRSIIMHSFLGVLDATATRAYILRSVIFRAAQPAK
ncbi:MAG TPA: hypothetical protein VNN18_00180 [Candidatus Xenobia bacterium]|nr:hypothetical protein [Candidatus Xenobia bacterium]